MSFVFRAAAALDVRRRQEEIARRASASAESAVNEAAGRVLEAACSIAADVQRLVAVQQAGTEAWRLEWHNAWLVRQRRDLAAHTRELADRKAEAAVAAQVTMAAAKRRKVLERLRDRAWRRHQRAEHEQHIRDMNDLATMRFVAQVTTEGGRRAD